MNRILVAGASGFIGKALIKVLLQNEDYEIVALSRRDQESNHPRLIWRRCDLFSLKDLNECMGEVNQAYYLVHSMLPSAALSQGSFYDFDLLMADNFARAAKKANVSHIVYLGGMIPEIGELTWHLKSRLEVEETLRSSQITTTTIRAGLIIGPHGSSFTILQKLVERLPIMVCPPWTKTLSQPVALQDMIRVLVRVIESPNLKGKIYDIGGTEILNYQDLILKTAHLAGKSPPLLTLTLIPLRLSRFWVSLITSSPRNLVYPLVLSLKHEMLAAKDHAWPHPEDLETPLSDSLREALLAKSTAHASKSAPVQHDVRSIQRLPLPIGKTAEWATNQFFTWIPTAFPLAIKVRVTGNLIEFYLFTPKLTLLILEKNVERSASDRQLLYIRGGILARKSVRGRLEFREVLNQRYLMAAIHDYFPALPWFIYRFTQAKAHLWTMKAFGRFLRTVAPSRPLSKTKE